MRSTDVKTWGMQIEHKMMYQFSLGEHRMRTNNDIDKANLAYRAAQTYLQADQKDDNETLALLGR